MDYTGVGTTFTRTKFESTKPNDVLFVTNPGVWKDFVFLMPADLLCGNRIIGSSLTMQIDSTICSVSDFVKIQSPSEVSQYLLENPGLIFWVEKICKETALEFRDYARLFLEVYKDPEINFQYLTLLIRQQEYHDDFLEKIEGFRQQYEDNLSNINGTLLITTDFQPIQG